MRYLGLVQPGEPAIGQWKRFSEPLETSFELSQGWDQDMKLDTEFATRNVFKISQQSLRDGNDPRVSR